jgi:hypothetical protein
VAVHCAYILINAGCSKLAEIRGGGELGSGEEVGEGLVDGVGRGLGEPG